MFINKLSFFNLMIFAVLTGLAQSPALISYQAILRDASNNLLAERTIGIQLSILQGTLNGVTVYSETQTSSTDNNGVLSIVIGEGTGSNNFSDIDWPNGPYFIKIETDITGGNDYNITGISQLISIPYTLHAKTAGNAFSGNYNDLSNKPNLPEVPSDISYFHNDAGYISILNDDNVTNELQKLSVSIVGDTLYLSKSNFVIIEGISAANSLLSDTSYIDTSDINNNFITDIDGNVYKSVIIGNQEWLAENLRTSTYANGEPIVKSVTEWSELNTGAYCYYDNDNRDEVIYGKLYNWYAVSDSRNICPTGWHVPSKDEWNQLSDFLSSNGHLENEAGVLKSSERWETFLDNPSSGNGTDTYGFKGLPGGLRTVGAHGFGAGIVDLKFRLINFSASFWTSSEFYECCCSWYFNFNHRNQNIFSNGINKRTGNSVRCLKDIDGEVDNIVMPTITTAPVNSITTTDSSAISGGNIENVGGEALTASGIVWDTVSNPTIDLYLGITSDSVQSCSFVSDLSGLNGETTYYVRAYATNSAGTAYGSEVSFLTEKTVLTDIDGNIYTAVFIGEQKWMVENLKTTKYSNGDLIPEVTNDAVWSNLTTDAYCWYDNDNSYDSLHGKLYNFYVVSDSRNVCPVGWHVATGADWRVLINFLEDDIGYNAIGATSLKASEGWEYGELGNGTDDYGFKALPSGSRWTNGNFSGFGACATYWASEGNSALTREICYYGQQIYANNNNFEKGGYSVRCLKD